MASQVYYLGDWYEAVELTAPGESPGGYPDKWRKLEIPRVFESFLVQNAYSLLLYEMGQNDKAGIEERRAQGLLDMAAHRSVGSTGAAVDQRADVFAR